MSEAICKGRALEDEARVDEAPGVLEFVPPHVRQILQKALDGMIEEIRGLGSESCLRQSLEESDLRLSIAGWTFRIRTRETALSVVAATPK